MAVVNHFKNVSELMLAVREARMAAKDEAHRTCGRGALYSRGMHVKAVNAAGDIVRGEAESWLFGGKAAEFEELVKLLDEEDVSSVSIEGGFDWAVNPRAYSDCDYDCWVSEWCVEFGSKKEAA